ncbi:gliding motility-associated C-terminal domain-containing protein [Spirosoma sp. KCTC 42546]|uniref:gliding motility-associated C-terminal domain-containing protein n=1 Tax=Spirosoma sp. KCTC 42546 TaxID=2520506 RepID=UPI001159C6A2|nr:gliding motility-associated C-terminal domain-containing protein [Spirosoma sp. KCTC 42546]QDK79944.1 gliding motility-associated C-terminal domain-containing protein [Spirosoma sp. KCTC 42546]
MIRFLGLLGWGWFLAGIVSYGQTVDCRNIGFEENSFRGWTRYIGFIKDSAQQLSYELRPGSEYIGLGKFGHTITHNTDGVDPLVSEPIPVVAPGSQYSLRLGGPDIGTDVNQIRATLLVSAEKPLLLVQFAVILQESTHKPYQQAAFHLLIRNAAGDTIPCGTYTASAALPAVGFKTDPKRGILYRNWTSSVLDLRPYVGQQLQVEVTAHGCADGGHFGYAYFDAQCLSAMITPTTVCSSQTSRMHLSAPTGFDQYQWNTGDTTATISIIPNLGDKYSVRVRSRSTLRPQCGADLTLPYQVEGLTVPTRQTISLCSGESYAVGDSVYTRSGVYRNVIERAPPLCDSILLTEITVLPLINTVQRLTLCAGSSLTVGDSVYHTTGNYQTRIHRAAPLCDSLVTTQLVITQVSLDFLPDMVVTQGDSLQLKAAVPTGSNYVYEWSPKEGLSCPSCAITWAKPTQTTQYQLVARLPDSSCETSRELTVHVRPCRVAIPNTFTPNGDGINDHFRLIANPCLGRLRQLIIYNRWGQVVFHQEMISALDTVFEWDGTYQGELVHTGVYSYQLTLEFITGKVNQQTGSLVVIR